MVIVDGLQNTNPSELYVLRPDGSAEWIFVNLDKGGLSTILSKKTGTWIASEQEVTITIKGNTGPISEKFSKSDDIFRYGTRYLQKTD